MKKEGEREMATITVLDSCVITNVKSRVVYTQSWFFILGEGGREKEGGGGSLKGW